MRTIELAKITGIDRSYLWKIVTGKRNAGRITAQKLTDAVPGTCIIDWMFARQNYKRLQRIVQELS